MLQLIESSKIGEHVPDRMDFLAPAWPLCALEFHPHVFIVSYFSYFLALQISNYEQQTQTKEQTTTFEGLWIVYARKEP